MSSVALLTGAVAVAARSDEARAAWPPAPNADLRDPASWPDDPGYGAEWSDWSWLPSQAAGTAPYLSADAELGAAGMSVDRAWTLTIGRPDVRIAVIGSGIAWDAADLLDKAYLNPGELQGDHRPRAADGKVCGGAGPLAGLDCNGDGVFSVSDYLQDPRISPVVPGDACFRDPTRTKPGGPDRIKGDVNHNCVLDAGDLIALFSDGVDDDLDGYTDDVSGWDFFKNDNDPYDDTRDGQGTREAAAAAAEGNNGKESIGTCPRCRFTALRTGDSTVADANDVAKALVYATDTGAKVALAAVFTVDQTPFARSAIDYAYAHGVTVVASMGLMGSRHHATPATANHTLTVHAITHDGPSPASATTFLAFDTCGNFGGQLALSASGEGCAGGVTGRVAGMAGLVYSLGLAGSLDLDAEEVRQLLVSTADDIDVAASRAGGPFAESLPGFDQRFGYGRANAYAALARVRDGLIPPEVDIVSPEWFAPVYGDRVVGQVAIVGRVAASRAVAYDYAVEWAPGVEPRDGDWRPLATEQRNIPASTDTGGPDRPLATFDPRQLDTTHAADPDSPHGENDRTVTLRVRAVAHYGASDVRGEARRTIAVVNESNALDTDLLPGFPLRVGASVEASPKLADLDGDGFRDIILATTDGLLHAYSLRTLPSHLPAELPGFPARTRPVDGLDPAPPDPTVPSYVSAAAYAAGASGGIDPTSAREAIVATPAVADMDGDGVKEIVFTTWPGTVYVIDAHGATRSGWPKRLPAVPSCPLDPSKPAPKGACMDVTHGVARGALASPVLVDMDRDGRLEIVQAAFDGNVYVFHLDGTPLDGFPVALHAPPVTGTRRVVATPAVTDFNGDGIPDLACASSEEIGGAAGPAFLVDGRGARAPGGPFLPRWPVTVPSLHLLPLVGEGLAGAPAAADFDGDGSPEVLFQGNGASPLLVPADPGLTSAAGDPANALPLTPGEDGAAHRGFFPAFGAGTRATPGAMIPLFGQPAVGDLDQDGTPDVIAIGGSPSLVSNLAGGPTPRPAQHLLAMWSGKTARMMAGAPVVLEDYALLVNPAVADVTGDDYPEVLTGTGGYFVHAVDACGREAQGWPKLTNGWIVATPAVGDVDGDADRGLEVVTATREGYLFAWHTRGRADGVIAWESFHHDGANTGDSTRSLDQGTALRATTPIDCSAGAPATESGSFEPGGCAVARLRTREARGERSIFGAFLALCGVVFGLRARKNARSRRASGS